MLRFPIDPIACALCATGWLVASTLCGCADEATETPAPTGCADGCAGAATTSGGHGGAAPGGSGGAGAAGASGGSGGFGGDGGAGASAGAGGSSPSGTYKTTLEICWLEPDCHRALVVAHGGDWNTSDRPFLSRAAFAEAVSLGADAIESDVRVTADLVPVVAHSSPIEYYESLDCGGRRIEEMTAAEVTQCHLLPSQSETIQRLDDALGWADGKVILELDVKEPGALAATIDTILALGAEDRTFILVSTDEITNVLPTVTGWSTIHYMVRIGAPADVAPMLQLAPTHNVFLFEMDRSYSGADEAAVTSLLTTVMAPAGVKGLTSSDQYVATVQNHVDVYHQGFDVVLSYDLANGVDAAALVNLERGYAP